MTTADSQASIREFILRNIVTSLSAIEARLIPADAAGIDQGSSGYNFTPEFVKRISRFHNGLIDTLTGKAGYYITTGREEPTEGMTGRRFQSRLEVFVLAATQHRDIAEDPFRRNEDDETIEDTVRNAILQDAIRALTLDFTRGRLTLPAPIGNRGAASNTNIPGIRVDQGQFLPWVFVEIALLIDYDFPGMQP